MRWVNLPFFLCVSFHLQRSKRQNAGSQLPDGTGEPVQCRRPGEVQMWVHLMHLLHLKQWAPTAPISTITRRHSLSLMEETRALPSCTALGWFQQSLLKALLAEDTVGACTFSTSLHVLFSRQTERVFFQSWVLLWGFIGAPLVSNRLLQLCHNPGLRGSL